MKMHSFSSSEVCALELCFYLSSKAARHSNDFTVQDESHPSGHLNIYFYSDKQEKGPLLND